MVVVEVDKEKVNETVLTELQNSGDRLSHAMAAYVAYLLPRLNELRAALPRRFEEARASFQRRDRRARQAGSLAMLALGFDELVNCAVENGAIDGETADRYSAAARDALAGIGSRQGQHLRDIDVADRFLEVLRQEVAQGRAVLLNTDLVDFGPRPGRETLGMHDSEYAFVLPDVARRIVSTCLRDAGEGWEVSTHMLHKALVKKGYVIPAADGRIEVQRRMGKSRPRMLKMPLRLLHDEEALDSGPGSGAPPGWRTPGAGGPQNYPLLNRPIGNLAPAAPVARVLATNPPVQEEGALDERHA